MSSSEARQRRVPASRSLYEDDDNNERAEGALDTRPIFDIPESQLLIVTCGVLVFLSVAAIFLVLIFSLTGAAAVVEEPLPPLPTCFGFIDLPENSQPPSTCSSTIDGVCDGLGQCSIFVQLSDIASNQLLPDVFACESSACANGAATCTCAGIGGDPSRQACIRETGQFGKTNFLCRDERQCPPVDLFPDLGETEPCQLGAEIEGLCSEAEFVCQYSVLLPDGETSETRFCTIGECITNVSCTCPDLVCVRGEIPIVCT